MNTVREHTVFQTDTEKVENLRARLAAVTKRSNARKRALRSLTKAHERSALQLKAAIAEITALRIAAVGRA